MPQYNKTQLEQIGNAHKGLELSYERLILTFMSLKLSQPEAAQFATHGVCRRLKLVKRCIDRVFDIISPTSVENPNALDIVDTTINLQSFIFNVYGSLDNLAWIWFLERGGDSRLKPKQIGLGPNYEKMRLILSQDMQDYLKTRNEWFSYLTEFRHALAHRIPPYIPPYIIDPSDEGTYRELEENMLKAAAAGQLAEHDQLSKRQRALGKFRPWLVGSHSGKSRPIGFHPQMIADFLTLEEMALRFSRDLTKPPSPAAPPPASSRGSVPAARPARSAAG